MPSRRHRPSPAMLVALLALVLAMTGTATAAVLVSSSDQLADSVVSSPKIATDAITSRALDEPSVGVSNLTNGAVTNAKLATSSVDTRALTPKSVNSSRLADRQVNNGHLVSPIFSAAVSANGTTSTARSTGVNVSGTRRISEGVYEVSFQDDVRNCAITATPNGVGSGFGLLFSPGMRPPATADGALQVLWFAQSINGGGRALPNDTPFSVIAQC